MSNQKIKTEQSVIDGYKEALNAYVESEREGLFKISRHIFSNPEMAFQERTASATLVAYLEANGFSVTHPAGGLDTAFVATYARGGDDAPRVAVLCEYDALSIGHACGHNIIGTSGVGAGVALKRLLEAHPEIQVTLHVVGTPAEESGGGKIIMQKAGVFDGMDALLLLHPTSGVSKVAGRCKSSHTLDVVYTGKKAHASSHPDLGINAMDAAVMCYSAVGLMRQQMSPEVSVVPIITEPGKDDGFIPDRTAVRIKVRAMKDADLGDAIDKVRGCIQGSASATGCTYTCEETEGYKGRVINETIGNICRENFQRLGEPIMPGFVDDNGGEDFGNLSREIPGMMVYPTLLPEKKISNHTEQFMELAGSAKGEEVILLGSKVLAYSLLDLIVNPDLIERAKEELQTWRETTPGIL